MDWITPDNLKANYQPVRDLTNAAAQEAIDSAEDELIELVGQDVVNDAKAVSPSDTTRAERLVRGHKFLAVSIGVWNTKNIKRQQDPRSPGTGAAITNEVWNPKDIETVSDYWRSRALKAIGAYLLVEVVGDDYSTGIEYSHPSEVTCYLTNDCR